MMQTASSNVTYTIDKPCPGDGETPCDLTVMTDEYGNKTPHLWCPPHGEVVGYVTVSDHMAAEFWRSRMLRASGLPYVIENVEGAPLIDPVMLCGTMFPGLRVIRHRLFETNFPVAEAPTHWPHPLVFTHDKRKAHYGKLDQDTSFVQVTGGGNATVKNKRAAMGIDWMTGAELNEAIPPAYTKWIGYWLREEVERRVAA